MAQRRALLEREGILYRAPYIESTPRYQTSRHFAELDLPTAALSILTALADPPAGGSRLVFDPPYTHQATALEAVCSQDRSLVVTTGTGSGKTETFLLPILAKLAEEAANRPTSFATPSLRALLLYPMNALVNDQLGRLRLLFGSPLVTSQFEAWAGRPARFARYTSRTLYPGVRTAKKDGRRLKSIEHFYVKLLQQANDAESPHQDTADRLIRALQDRGKWPAKPDLKAWYGGSGTRWANSAGQFVRAVMRPEDPELLTRHEVLANTPDVLVTNYSMLEYMLMRPLERPVFDATRAWLSDNPDERLLLVVDEAHLYRGAAGAEVALLLRRLRARLGIAEDRLQVICTSASFDDIDHAREFAAQLSGKAPSAFDAIEGKLALRPDAARGSEADARALAAIDLDRFYKADDDAVRTAEVRSFVDHRGRYTPGDDYRTALYSALESFPPMSALVNSTMSKAMPLSELAAAVFDGVDRDLADRAVTTLIALGSVARRAEGEPGLLPCRVHGFFRGLPGLWACMDSECTQKRDEHADSPIGDLFSQPIAECGCGARVFEVYTCRNCGSAYARAYTDDLDNPTFLWNEPGGAFMAATGHVGELHALDLLLEEPTGPAEPAELDLITGRLNPMTLGERTRPVFIKLDRAGGDPGDDENGSSGSGASGEFKPCGVCLTTAGYGRSSVQDHQTKGDQPFQALVTRQIEVQPPSPQTYSDFAPLQGRKVLAFSDSRQTAARLAPNLQTYSMQDVIRPLILRGWRELDAQPFLAPNLGLEDLFLAALVGSHQLGVRLRPELKGTESFRVMDDVDEAIAQGALDGSPALMQLALAGRTAPPQSLLRGIVSTLTDRYYGLQSLALASLRERRNLESALLELPAIPEVASTDAEKLALARLWISQWLAPVAGIWFDKMDPTWWKTSKGVRPHSGKFRPLERWLGSPTAKRAFETDWLPILLERFCESKGPRQFTILAGTLALDVSDGWGYCQACRTTQRPFPGTTSCTNCGRDRVDMIDPNEDPVFTARKGYYRNSSVRALADPPDPPMAIIAAEHTAQLNAAQSDEVFSKAEEHELLFQDVNIGIPTPGQRRPVAIDVLSCTTTMEVGIDIGTLSGVALRNMPPSRASYQQRAGRAGRRGNSVASVVAFGSADSHDEHYFREPDAMIRGQVDDPVLTLDNVEIARRHVTAYIFQRYHQARLPEIDPEEQPQLFEVLGNVEDFLSGAAPLGRDDFETWMRDNRDDLATDIADWLPGELSATEREALLTNLVDDTLAPIDAALGHPSDPANAGSALGEVSTDSEDAEDEATADDEAADAETEATVVEAPAEEGEERGESPRRVKENLLDRLLYKGVLPRYAFPTDVVSFYVFDRDRSTRFRPEFRYAPSQGLPVALSQYAPGKEIWIDGKLWTSGALYSPMSEDRYDAWQDRRLYQECEVCHYARTCSQDDVERGAVQDCPACGSADTFGPARNWMRPPGFAHPTGREEGTSLDDQPARSYATRAKLVASGPADPEVWRPVTPRIRQHYQRRPLLVTNTGPRQEGYSYCFKCGLIEPTGNPTHTVTGPHLKPYPDEKDSSCPAGHSTKALVLGTDFISDVLLVSLRVDRPLTLRPEFLATHVALRTLAEALTFAATKRLEIEPGEVQAEYRPALSPGGRDGLEAEIYLYDTLPGGAGFARRMGDLGPAVFEEAIALLEDCPGHCDHSCYRCLRSFKNRFEHDLLDRHLGVSLLRYLVHGTPPVLHPSRLQRATDRLFEDLARQGLDSVELQRDAQVDIPGVGKLNAPILATKAGRELIIGVHAPLTPDHPSTDALHDAKEFGMVPVLLVDEIVISLNLPAASGRVIEELG